MFTLLSCGDLLTFGILVSKLGLFALGGVMSQVLSTVQSCCGAMLSMSEVLSAVRFCGPLLSMFVSFIRFFFGVEVIVMPEEGGLSNLSKMSTSGSSVTLNVGPPENLVKSLRLFTF